MTQCSKVVFSTYSIVTKDLHFRQLCTRPRAPRKNLHMWLSLLTLANILCAVSLCCHSRFDLTDCCAAERLKSLLISLLSYSVFLFMPQLLFSVVPVDCVTVGAFQECDGVKLLVTKCKRLPWFFFISFFLPFHVSTEVLLLCCLKGSPTGDGWWTAHSHEGLHFYSSSGKIKKKA